MRHINQKPNIEVKFDIPHFQWYLSMTFSVTWHHLTKPNLWRWRFFIKCDEPGETWRGRRRRTEPSRRSGGRGCRRRRSAPTESFPVARSERSGSRACSLLWSWKSTSGLFLWRPDQVWIVYSITFHSSNSYHRVRQLRLPQMVPDGQRMWINWSWNLSSHTLGFPMQQSFEFNVITFSSHVRMQGID